VVDQTVQMRLSNGTGAKGGLFASRSDSDPDTYFMARTGSFAGGGGDNLVLIQVVDGVQTNLGQFTYDMLQGVNYNLRFTLDVAESGNVNLRAKLWVTGDPEPAEWSVERLEVDEPRLKNVTGRFGIISTNSVSDRAVYYDNYAAVGEIGVSNTDPTASFTPIPASGDRMRLEPSPYAPIPAKLLSPGCT